MPVTSEAHTVPGSTSRTGRAPRTARRRPSRPPRRVHRRGEEAGGDEHEHDPGEAEEAAEVEPHAAAVDADTERDGHREPEQDAQPRGHGSRSLLEGGEQEDRGLEALAQHGEERHPDERPTPTRGRARRPRRPGAARATRARGAHPDDHVRDHRDGDERDEVSSPSCARCGSSWSIAVSTAPTARHRRTARATPDHIRRSARHGAPVGEERRHDPHDGARPRGPRARR